MPIAKEIKLFRQMRTLQGARTDRHNCISQLVLRFANLLFLPLWNLHGVNEGLRRGGGEGRELRADNKLVVRALARKAIALLKVAAHGADYDPVIRALQQLLAEHYCKERLAKQREAEEARKGIEKLERLDLEAADHH
uniref:Uncharacterized protein n=1 Tax=Leersia perrieri TaxID=77586 RepID=A0A0D9WX02_9ORYZ